MKNQTYTFKNHLKESLKSRKFKKAWNESEAEYLLSKSLIEARMKKKLSQRALAKKIGTSQAVISRIESMRGNPSLFLLKRIAKALDGKLHVSV
jgi:ribosome-binding protein aMBF1 (putative translation factor)